MNINILGFNIFAKGGTSRSNINLVKSFLNKGHKIKYFNAQDFKKTDVTSLIIHEDLNNEDFSTLKFNGVDEISNADLLIITRESFFKYARDIKKNNKDINIIGEIHGPLKYIDDSIDLALDYIDSIRVSTESIKREFKKLYNYESVFSQYVNAEHIHINSRQINTKRNFLIKARFEDSIKDISYVIKLFNYIVKNTNRTDIQLYIIGYGPSEILYNNLIKYYNLQNNIHINQKEPLNYIYISSSPYETLGYSILETIANGNRALIFPGKDKVLKEVYSKYYAVEFLEKNIIRDSEILISLLNEKYTQYKRKVDVENLKNDFLDSNYSDKYLLNFENSKNEYTIMPVKTVGKYKIQKRGQLERLNNGKILYARMKEKPLFSKLLKNDYFFKKVKEIYGTRKSKLHKKVLDKIIPDENKVFIESFHGSNFSGDPKYLALNIKEMYREKEVYVSSKNSLVDIEIRNYGFKPVRFGSENYIETFRKCKYVFMNGNSWDKVDKHKNQKFIQTWHGFPLKKMVNDLGDDKERILQNKLFQPRMEKWDYLLSSSTINSMLLKSAFRLENNLNLNILEYGAPRNEFLLENYDENNWQKLQRKYLFIEDNEKKYILFCPTWRKSKRENLTNINLKKLLDYLPENYEIIVKLHPNESGLRTKYNKLDSRIHCFYNEFVDIQELYLLCDVMITDYSSTIFDYAHLNKPIFLLQEDSKTYQKDVGFYFNIFELGKFPVASLDEKKLALQIKNIKQIDYTNLIERIVNNDKKGSTKDILNEVFYN